MGEGVWPPLVASRSTPPATLLVLSSAPPSETVIPVSSSWPPTSVTPVVPTAASVWSAIESTPMNVSSSGPVPLPTRTPMPRTAMPKNGCGSPPVTRSSSMLSPSSPALVIHEASTSTETVVSAPSPVRSKRPPGGSETAMP